MAAIMRLSPASDGNNSKYVLEVVGLINNQKVVELLSSTEWQMYNHLVTRCRLLTRLQRYCRSAAEQRGREVNCSEGRSPLPRSARRKNTDACRQTGVPSAPLHFHCMGCFSVYGRDLESARKGNVKIVTSSEFDS